VAVYGRRRVGKTYLIRQEFTQRLDVGSVGEGKISLGGPCVQVCLPHARTPDQAGAPDRRR